MNRTTALVVVKAALGAGIALGFAARAARDSARRASARHRGGQPAMGLQDDGQPRLRPRQRTRRDARCILQPELLARCDLLPACRHPVDMTTGVEIS